ncbi:MAG: hypothetical protein WAU62_12265 [Dehalococcoidales bacterium]
MDDNEIYNHYDHSPEFPKTRDGYKYLTLEHLRKSFEFYIAEQIEKNPATLISELQIEAILEVIRDNNQIIIDMIHDHKHP